LDLSANEKQVLKEVLKKQSKTGVSERSLKISGLGEREIASATSYLEKKGLFKIEPSLEVRYELGIEGRRYLAEGLPERKLLELLIELRKVAIPEVTKRMGEDGRVAITQLSQLGVKPESGVVVLPSEEKLEAIKGEITDRERLLSRILDNPEGLNDTQVSKFRKRGTILLEKKTTSRIIFPTQLAKEIDLTDTEDKIGTLTPEIITSGKWKNEPFRSYDLNIKSEKQNRGFLHPLTLLMEKIRRIFLDMGFTEMNGHYVEYAGWNMDALFIPQHHPAREMQDTFYLEASAAPALEHPEVFDIIGKTHENGIPGYTGWGYRWDKAEARKLLLRTHTTVSTIRYLYEHPQSPQAIFSVDKVFRHESIDWKHLAELHQIEGAVCSPDASIASLKWLMKEFYLSLGFKNVRFIPSYYPYTEPSVDAVAEIDGREVELGGSGLFRPEVTRPLGIKDPVIAWGLGMERLAMLYYNLQDIREIYQSDIDWLRSFRIRI
jgi:phenylalanyl-tRNA synthetase alpha chain